MMLEQINISKIKNDTNPCSILRKLENNKNDLI